MPNSPHPGRVNVHVRLWRADREKAHRAATRVGMPLAALIEEAVIERCKQILPREEWPIAWFSADPDPKPPAGS